MAIDAGELPELAAIGDLLRASRWQDALTAAQRLALQEPTSPGPLVLAARALHGQGRSQEALDVIEQAVALRPDAPAVRRQQAELLVAFGRHDEAAKALEFVVAGDGQGEAAFELGRIYATLDQPEAAAAAFAQAARARPEWAEAHGNRGTALGLCGQIDDSVLAFERALAIQPDNGTWWYNLGLAHWAKGRKGRAHEAFAQALQAKPDLADAVSDVLGAPLARVEGRARLLRLLLVLLPLALLLAWGLLGGMP